MTTTTTNPPDRVRLADVRPGQVLYRSGERIAVESLLPHDGAPDLFSIRWEDGELSIPLSGATLFEVAGAQLHITTTEEQP